MAVSPFWISKYLSECGEKSWNLFYRRNRDHFFRDRHWLSTEFVELTGEGADHVLLEIGCGVGNLLFPLLAEFPLLHGYGIEISTEAVKLLKASPEYAQFAHRLTVAALDFITAVSNIEQALGLSVRRHVNADVLDLKELSLTKSVATNGGPFFTLATLVFVLSAVPATKHHLMIQNAFQVCLMMLMFLQLLRPRGVLFFRDYAINDLAQHRFKKDRQLDEHTFVRQDGTLSFFFSIGMFLFRSLARSFTFVHSLVILIPFSFAIYWIEYAETLFTGAGFVALENRYVTRQTVNAKSGLNLERTFLQARWVKPDNGALMMK